MATIESVAADIRSKLAGQFNDLDYVAQLFEDSTILDSGPGGELESRLNTILRASSDGSDGGVSHFAAIFSGCRDRGFRPEFRDGSNQVGHFMTAVDMGYRPAKLAAYAKSLGAATDPNAPHGRYSRPMGPGPVRFPWEEEICVRMIIGHEQVSDRGHFQWFSNALAVLTPDQDEITDFFLALNQVSLTNANLGATRAALAKIHINNGPGNSIMDLHLSLYGYQFGRFIRKGMMTTRRAAAAWLRWNIAGTFAFAQRA